MTLKPIITLAAVFAALTLPCSCSGNDTTEKKEEQSVTWTVTRFSYTSDGTTNHASYAAFKKEFEDACKACEGKSLQDANPILSEVTDKYQTTAYRPYYMDVAAESESGIFAEKGTLH